MSIPYTAAGGPRLSEFLDGLPVDRRWISGHHVVWTTGQQDRAKGQGPEAESHCSAFVAAVAMMLDVYVLRPPNHPQELLANAQVDWLAGTATFHGPSAADSLWIKLGRSGDQGALSRAINLAATGQLVLAGYAEPPVTDPATGKAKQRPGHIAIVRPQPTTLLPADGPDMVSVGTTNSARTSMKTAFKDHPGAWPSAIQLFAHASGLESDSPPGAI